MMRALLAAPLCAGWLLHGAEFAHAQAYPNKEPIKVVVPFPPGRPTDGVARIISERLGTVLGQSIVIENRGGAGGSIGGKFVAAADPDGYTRLINLLGNCPPSALIGQNGWIEEGRVSGSS